MEYNETISSLKGLVIFDTPKIMVLLKDLQVLVNIEKPKGAIGKKNKTTTAKLELITWMKFLTLLVQVEL